MINVSGFGSRVTIVALSSFPVGFTLSEFSDDADPLVFEETEPTSFEMLYDGSLFAFDKAAPVICKVSVIPGSNDDINLKILLQARKGAIQLVPIPDVTSMVITYPDDGRVMLTAGTILSGPMADSIVQQGRKKANTYTFAFGAFAGMQNGKQLAAEVVRNVLGLL